MEEVRVWGGADAQAHVAHRLDYKISSERTEAIRASTVCQVVPWRHGESVSGYMRSKSLS